MNKKHDSCAAHITRVATNVDFWAIWSEFLSKLKGLEWIFIEIWRFWIVLNTSNFCFRRTKKTYDPPPAAGGKYYYDTKDNLMNTRLRWVRIHNRGRAASQSFKTHMPKNAAALHTP